jgi:cytidylate kinase
VSHSEGGIDKQRVITIDGPSGAGKTTVSRLLAGRLGYRYVDTGALYRALAWAAARDQIAPGDDAGLKHLCDSIDLRLDTGGGQSRVHVDGTDVTALIRTPEMTMMASAVSAKAVVRSFLLERQREMGRIGGAVFEGRDMGTVVFPQADVKFFLDAAPETRARRRFAELPAGSSQRLSDVLRDMALRDRNDSSRELAPLKPAPDAIIVDSTALDAQQVVDLMMACLTGKKTL